MDIKILRYAWFGEMGLAKNAEKVTLVTYYKIPWFG